MEIKHEIYFYIYTTLSEVLCHFKTSMTVNQQNFKLLPAAFISIVY